MKKLIVLSVLLVCTRFYDVFTTYKYIPDLKGETNPMVSVFNFGWIGSLTVQFLALTFLIYCLYIYCFLRVETPGIDKNISLKQFISMFHFGTENDFSKLLYKIPTNKNSIFYSIGAVVPKALIIISLIVGTSTSTLIFSQQYRLFYREYKIPMILYVLMIAIIFILSIDFYRKERASRIKIANEELG